MPANLVAPDLTRTRNRRRSDIDTVPIVDLDEDQRVLIDQAAAIVRELVVADGGDLTALADSDRARKREARQLKRQFKDWRRELHEMEDADADATPTERASRAQSLRVINFLMNVVLADGQTAGDIEWPDGADWVLALEHVVQVFENAGEEGWLPGTRSGYDDPRPQRVIGSATRAGGERLCASAALTSAR